MENVNTTENTNATATEGAPVKKEAPKLKKLAQFETPDGKVFATQKEASQHLRRHLKVSAVEAVASTFDAAETTLSDWLLANEAVLKEAFAADEIKRPAPSAETMAKMQAARLKREADLKAFREAQEKAAAEAAAANGTAPAADSQAGEAQPTDGQSADQPAAE